MICIMMLFGTVGLFRRWIPLSSSMISLCRGAVGALVLLLVQLLSGQPLTIRFGKKKGALLLFSGVLMGANWILLFEAYRFTTMATATICYYMAPVFMLLASPLLGEKLTAKKGLCVLGALLGMVLVSGILEGGLSGAKGIVLGLLSAVMYAAIVLLNKWLSDIPARERTVIQLGTSAVTLLPYVLLTGEYAPMGNITPLSLVLLAVLCVIHTGIAYSLYFRTLERLPAQTTALVSYMDPITACLLSVTVLQEPMTPLSGLGIFIVLGSIACSEISFGRKPKDRN